MPEEQNDQEKWFQALKLEADKALLDLHFIKQGLTKEKWDKAEINQKVAELRGHIEGLLAQSKENTQEMFENMQRILAAAKNQIMALKAPPLTYGKVMRINPDNMVDIEVSGASPRRKVNFAPGIYIEDFKIGQRVCLNDAMNIVMIDQEWEKTGQEAKVVALLGEDVVRVITHLDETHDVILAEPLRGVKIREGDELLISGSFAFTKLPKSREIESLALDVVPDITYDKIGGLRGQIENIRDAIESPFIYPEYFLRYKLEAPKGVLLYGPPGCGKTLIAKAIANSLAERLKQKHNRDIKGYFISVKGPEILNRYVGESERKIRDIFQKARDKADENCPVIIFIDEADSILRTRGQGISSDVEITIVPQFLAELDGMEKLENVLVILASNRQDLIDPAVLRPGRIDIKVKIDRPDKIGAREIFSIYITPNLPLNAKYFDPKHSDFSEQYKKFNSSPAQLIEEHGITEVVRRLWATELEPYIYKDESGNEIKADNRVMKIITEEGELTLYLKDLVSGAMIKSIVDRGKKFAVKREIAGGEEGLLVRDFCMGVEIEMQENEELPNTRDDAQRWLDIQGRRERVVHVTPFAGKRNKDKQKKETIVSTGHYL